MSEKEFYAWKKDWFRRIPNCEKFNCCHEIMTCAITPLCGCGSIYETYKKQSMPRECDTVSCDDCFEKYECNKNK